MYSLGINTDIIALTPIYELIGRKIVILKIQSIVQMTFTDITKFFIVSSVIFALIIRGKFLNCKKNS